MKYKIAIKTLLSDGISIILLLYPIIMALVCLMFIYSPELVNIPGITEADYAAITFTGVSFTIIYIPIISGGMLLLTFTDDRESNVISSLNVSPYSGFKYLLSKSIIVSVWSLIWISIVVVAFIVEFSVPPWSSIQVIFGAILLAFSVILIAIILSSFAKDKLEAMNVLKFGGLFIFLGAAQMIIISLSDYIPFDVRFIEIFTYFTPIGPPMLLMGNSLFINAGMPSSLFLLPSWGYLILSPFLLGLNLWFWSSKLKKSLRKTP